MATSTPIDVPCEQCPLRKNAYFRRFDDDELGFIKRFKQGEMRLEPGVPVILEDTASPHLYTMLEGWAFRFKTLPDGRRQILNFAMPGDFLGLQASIFETMTHGVETLTPVVLCVFPRDQLWNLFKSHASLAYDITYLAAREERSLDEVLLSVGRRSARERLALMLYRLWERAEKVGLMKRGQMHVPVTQAQFADALGLSTVHVNRSFQALRKDGCIETTRTSLTILDRERLLEIAGAPAEVEPTRPFI